MLNIRTRARFLALPEHLRDNYERKLQVDEILSIHTGFDAKGYDEWIDVVLMDGTREHWWRHQLSPYWDCNSIKLKKAIPLQVHQTSKTDSIGRLARNMRCRVCAAVLQKGTFARQLVEGARLRMAICIGHGSQKEVIEKAWATTRAPKEVKLRVGKRMMRNFIKAHSA